MHDGRFCVLADEVRVRDPRQVDAAGRCERVPLPQARVDLHQLELAVARIALELHLRQADVVERGEKPQRRVDGVLHPDGLADAAGADHRAASAAASGRRRRRAAGRSRQVAADGVERVVAAGNELLHHRCELLGARVGVPDLVQRLAAERLPAEALLEADVVLRLDEHRQPDLLGGAARLVRAPG